MALDVLKHHILPYWRSFIVILTPLAFLPIPIIAGTKEALCGYVILIMAIYWMTEALPLAITSLIPVVLFPLFGILDTGSICMAYMKETNMMFIGGLIMALAIEYCNLHKRIALGVLLLVGSSPRMLMAGFMAVTAFLSMWISNTATTAMMVPIVEAILAEMFKSNKVKENEPSKGSMQSISSFGEKGSSLTTAKESQQDLVGDSCKAGLAESGELDESVEDAKEMTRRKRLRVGAMLSIAYASNVGGTASLIGSSPQLALKGILYETFGPNTGLNFATFMAFNVPGAIINLILAWCWLQLLFVGFKRTTAQEGGKEREINRLLRQKYDELGFITFHELAVLVLFIFCVCLWFFRDPQFMPGWAGLIKDVHVDDATAVMLVVLILFSLPAQPNFWCLRSKGERGPEKPSKALMDWHYVQDRLPWGIVLLLGGGFALSDASLKSGLSTWLGAQLAGLSTLPPFVIMLIVCVLTATITEVASNTATANILLPVLAETSITININPIYLMLPATVTCSYAFMLPVATPPNAIVFAVAKMKPLQMIKAGFLMNLICVVVICVMTETLGVYMFDLYTFPDWAVRNETAPPTDCLNATSIYHSYAF